MVASVGSHQPSHINQIGNDRLPEVTRISVTSGI